MRRNCPACGERYEGSVCPKCGYTPAPRTHGSKDIQMQNKFLTDEQRAVQARVLEERRKDSRILIIVIVIAVLAAAFVLYRNGAFGGNYKKPITNYFNAICERDFEAYVSAMPARIGEDYISEREELGYTEYEYIDKLYSDLFEQFGEDMQISLEFGSRERPDEQHIESFRKDYIQVYGETINTNAVYGVNVVAHFSGEVSSADVELTCYVIRLSGRWYMVGCDFTNELE